MMFTNLEKVWPIIAWLLILSFHAGVFSFMVITMWRERKQNKDTYLTVDKHTDLCRINTLELKDGIIENVRDMIKAMKTDLLKAIREGESRSRSKLDRKLDEM